MNMRCHRCGGLLTPDSAWSLTETYTHLDYLRCVNCGNYQFEEGVSPESAGTYSKRQGIAHYAPSTRK